MHTLLHLSKALFRLAAVVLALQVTVATQVLAQDEVKVQNVRFDVEGTRIVVRFDVQGPLDREYTVKMLLRREGNPSFVHVPRLVVGDLGEGKFAGLNRQITWDILKEFPDGLEGDDYYFVVDVELIKPASKLIWWIGGGAAVVGGAVLLLKDTIFPPKGAAATPEGGFPKPVGRPTGS
ncbi:MAG: hypothetical protein FJ217_13480 [Ignavibacteria bacterium]|nr:hypothetical protein [Ignavibacteria bacterium]